MYKEVREEMVFCPYNRYHVVSKLRIQKHLIKCQKNYPNVKLATCFYNFAHRVKPEDMLKHYEVCSHKNRVESARYHEAGTFGSANISVNNEDTSFSFPGTPVRTQKHFYNPCKNDPTKPAPEYEENSAFPALKSKQSLLSMEKENFPKLVGSDKDDDDDDDDEDDDDMKPLPLPKTISKAFTCLKQQPNSSATKQQYEISQARGFGRAKNILRFSSLRPPETNDDEGDVDIELSERKISEFFSKEINARCSDSIVSSMFDDTNTLKSEDIAFDDDEDAVDENVNIGDDGDGDENFGGVNGFIFKNFDKYVKI